MAARAKILVTRPEPGASRTAKKLEEAGLTPLICPFTEMVAKPFDQSGIRSNFDAIIITSANAVRFLEPSFIRGLAGIPVHAVGDATAQAASKIGFSHVVSADGDAAALCTMVADHVPQLGNVLYLCGVTRTDHVEKTLGNAGYQITLVETYETKKVSQLTYNLTKMLTFDQPDGVAFYSGISAQLFADSVEALPKQQVADIKAIFCISDRAKNCLPEPLRARAHVCAAPQDDEMVRFIAQYYQA